VLKEARNSMYETAVQIHALYFGHRIAIVKPKRGCPTASHAMVRI
jgi:hypothetical protein